MGNVDAAHGAHHLGQLDHFFGGRKVSRHVIQAGGEAERAVAHALRRQRLHLFDFFRRGFAVHQPHHLLADGSLPHHGGEVDGDGRVRHPVQKRRQWQRRAAVGTFDDGGDAFAQVVLRGRDLEDTAAPMRVDVDEPGRHYQPPRIDAHRRRRHRLAGRWPRSCRREFRYRRRTTARRSHPRCARRRSGCRTAAPGPPAADTPITRPSKSAKRIGVLY